MSVSSGLRATCARPTDAAGLRVGIVRLGGSTLDHVVALGAR